MDDSEVSDPTRLGRELAAARAGRGISLREAAASAEISAAYLQKLERSQVAEPSPKILRRLATALDLPYRRLMELAGYELPSKPSNPFAARLAGASLTVAEERAVSAFVDHLISQRDGN